MLAPRQSAGPPKEERRGVRRPSGLIDCGPAARGSAGFQLAVFLFLRWGTTYVVNSLVLRKAWDMSACAAAAALSGFVDGWMYMPSLPTHPAPSGRWGGGGGGSDQTDGSNRVLPLSSSLTLTLTLSHSLSLSLSLGASTKVGGGFPLSRFHASHSVFPMHASICSIVRLLRNKQHTSPRSIGSCAAIAVVCIMYSATTLAPPWIGTQLHISF